MADCSRAAAGKKGAAYKEAVRSCMKGKATSPAATKMSPQEKMKHCSSEAKAKGLKGKEFKSSVSTCLKG